MAAAAPRRERLVSRSKALRFHRRTPAEKRTSQSWWLAPRLVFGRSSGGRVMRRGSEVSISLMACAKAWAVPAATPSTAVVTAVVTGEAKAEKRAEGKAEAMVAATVVAKENSEDHHSRRSQSRESTQSTQTQDHHRHRCRQIHTDRPRIRYCTYTPVGLLGAVVREAVVTAGREARARAVPRGR